MITWPETAIEEHLKDQGETAVFDLPERIAPVPDNPTDLTATLQRMRQLAAHNYGGKSKNGN